MKSLLLVALLAAPADVTIADERKRLSVRAFLNSLFNR